MASSSSYLLPFFLLPILLSPVSITAQTFRNISLGSSLSTNDQNPSWASPSGDFAFGFHRLPNDDGFLLAVWFDKVPEKTVVWYANGNNPVKRGSKVELTNDRRLILSDQRGREVWRAETSGRTVVSASMLDTGNFVLTAPNSDIVWGTFDFPTDTILPSQVLGLGTRLDSHLTETNYSNGRFILRLQADDGILVMYPVDLITRNPIDPSKNSAYYTSTAGSGRQLVFNASSGYIYLTLKNGSNISIASENQYMVPTKDYYHRATLDPDGGFRHYTYPKNGSGGGSNRPASWSIGASIPNDLCHALTARIGGGMCGYNGFCQLDDDARPKCSCPSGYSYVDPNIPAFGCKPDFTPHVCGVDLETGRFEMTVMINYNWPEGDIENHEPFTEEQCKEDCLNDCLCAAASFTNDGACWKKNLPLRNGRVEAGDVGPKALIKVATRNFSSEGGKEAGRKKEDRRSLILVGSLLSMSGFLNLALLFAVTMFFFCFSTKNTKTAAASDPSVPGTNLPSFTYHELVQITRDFKEEIGCGAFGTVYKGSMGCGSGVPVAVKKLNKVVKDGEKEFTAEVSTIGRIHHRNLVQLLGFCQEGPNRLLVYEFMSNGSLAKFLFGGSRPDWNLRLQIACGIAKGLMYLHEECETQIIHCDIKPQNILLDDHFTARIADFGLAKLLKTDHSRTYTSIRGTRGYVAPEWFRKGAISAKVDVYSFGVMLLEIICCRKNVDVEAESEREVILTDWVYDSYKEGKLWVIVEGDEVALSDQQRLERAVIVAICCTQEDPSLRPSMKTVIQMLEGTIQICAPPNPSSFSSIN